jgi:hypothetical protein
MLSDGAKLIRSNKQDRRGDCARVQSLWFWSGIFGELAIKPTPSDLGRLREVQDILAKHGVDFSSVDRFVMN